MTVESSHGHCHVGSVPHGPARSDDCRDKPTVEDPFFLEDDAEPITSSIQQGHRPGVAGFCFVRVQTVNYSLYF
jgi:hypothetical protein